MKIKNAKSVSHCLKAASLLLFVLVFTVFSSPLTVYADDFWPENISLSSEEESAMVIEQETGTVLYSKNADVVHYPASITKVMTALLALENCSMDEVVKYSHDAVYSIEPGSSHIARDEGEEMTMENCLYAMMLESCNETAYAIGEHVGGDMATFTDMMTRRAAELGCTNTHFSNPHGLPDSTHVTTAHDMALIAREAFKNKNYRNIVGSRQHTIPATNRHDLPYPCNNHHAMLNYYKTSKYLYDGCLGGKTGYTTVAHSTLVTYAQRDGMTLVCVIMNANSPAHYVDTTNLFNYCFDNFNLLNVAENEKAFGQDVTKDFGTFGKNEPPVSICDTDSIVLPKTAHFADATYEIVPGAPDASEENENVAGYLNYTYAGRPVGSAALLYNDAESEGAAAIFNNAVNIKGDGTENSGGSAAAAEASFEGDKTTGSNDTIYINLLYLIPIAIGVVGIILIIKSVRKRTEKVRSHKKRHYHTEKRTVSSDKYVKINRTSRKIQKKRQRGQDLTSSKRNSDSFIKN